MQFHVTATHSADNCPGYNRELMPLCWKLSKAPVTWLPNWGLRSILWLAPLPSMCRTYFWKPKIVHEYRYGQTRFLINKEFDINPVMHEERMAAMAREMMAGQQS